MQAKQRDAAPNSRCKNRVNFKIVSRVVSIAIISGIFLCMPQFLGARVASAGYALLFYCLLMAASLWDIRKRMIPDSICLLIFLTGLIEFSPVNLWGALFALPFFPVALIDQESMGGGDIKFLAAACSVLGVNASVWGFALAIPLPMGICIFKVLENVCRRQEKPWRVRIAVPLIPILTVGLLPAYFLKVGGLIL